MHTRSNSECPIKGWYNMHSASPFAFPNWTDPTNLKTEAHIDGITYNYDYISPEKVSTALRWLKENNALYANIDINEEWLQ